MREIGCRTPQLLNLSVGHRIIVDAFCDLMKYGPLPFSEEWRTAFGSTHNLDVLGVLLRLEKKSFSDPFLTPKMNRILRNVPRNRVRLPRRGVHLAEHLTDLPILLPKLLIQDCSPPHVACSFDLRRPLG
jgi:hypothetical protein